MNGGSSQQPWSPLRAGEIIELSDDEFEDNEPGGDESDTEMADTQASVRSDDSLLTEAVREDYDPFEQWEANDDSDGSHETRSAQHEREPRILFGATMDRYILRRPGYRQYIAQVGFTWTVVDTDSEAEDPDPLVETPISPRRLAIMGGSCTPEHDAMDEDPLLPDADEDLRLSGVDDDVLSLGNISIGSIEEIVFQALQQQTTGPTHPPQLAPNPRELELDQLPPELREEIEVAAKRGKRVCFRRDVNGRSYRVRISASGQVVVRNLTEEREKCEDKNYGNFCHTK